MRIPHNEPLGSASTDGRTQPGQRGSAPADPERKCVLTGEHGSRQALLRLAISPDGLVLPDPLAKAPGRGAWLGVSRRELEAAMKAGKGGGKLRGALARAFKGAALTVPDDLPERIEAALTRAFLDRLGLELRAGHVVMGSDRIAEQARAGMISLLLHASDASADGSRKLDQAWRVGRDAEGTGQQGVTLPLDRMALSVALGRDNVVHLALADDRAAGRVNQVLERLMHFLGDDPVAEAAEADAPVAVRENADRAEKPVADDKILKD
ncbi:MAG: nucleic-acid-binding protein [Erythrobacter sp. 34-65-8]|nr:MAG: nucleic-acid-binding protein [Erythrobacter sp. 34-65-8]